MVAKPLVLLLSAVASVTSIQVMFEQFKGCTSNGVLTCNLRVRKVNRTLATLYGNLTVHEDLGDDFLGSANLHYSALGNNQYNIYPMKISQIGICKFMKEFWADYYPYFVVYVPQMEKPGVCPITARTVQFMDMVLDARMFPRYVPTGLWKLVLRIDNSQTGKYFQLELIFRIYPDGHF